MVGGGELAVADDRVDQGVGVEDIVAHRGEDLVRSVGQTDRVLGLLEEFGDLRRDDAVSGLVARELDHAELIGELDRLSDRGDGRLGARCDVGVDHLREVHAVDVVGADHDDDVGLRRGSG